MTPQEEARLYDSFPPERQDMPREQFVRQAMDAMDLKANKKILDHMVQRKRQVTRGRIEQARIDAALRERG